jgi:hypothetical protein
VAANVPLAPTIGTATATGSTTATVTFTAPSDNGGATITGYTTSGGGSGSGASSPISVTGLSGGTAYSFTVTATNSAGTSAASGGSNTITTSLAIGQAYGGGYYAGQTNVSGTIYNMVVADKATGEARKKWGTYAVTAGTTSVINGAANSATLAALGADYQAAIFCEGLSSGGYTDWYLPAQAELNVAYYFLKPGTTSNDTGYGSNAYAVSPQPVSTNFTSGDPAQTSATNFRTGASSQEFVVGGDYQTDYWSSTEQGIFGAYATRFGTGYTAGQPKNITSLYARAMRKVAA